MITSISLQILVCFFPVKTGEWKSTEQSTNSYCAATLRMGLKYLLGHDSCWEQVYWASLLLMVYLTAGSVLTVSENSMK